jgi:hypothetical protein
MRSEIRLVKVNGSEISEPHVSINIRWADQIIYVTPSSSYPSSPAADPKAKPDSGLTRPTGALPTPCPWDFFLVYSFPRSIVAIVHSFGPPIRILEKYCGNRVKRGRAGYGICIWMGKWGRGRTELYLDLMI